MLVGVLADTHDRLPIIEEALGLFAGRGVEAIIHAGDYVAPFAARRLRKYEGPIYAVYGNNDGERVGLKEVLPQLQDGPLFVELDGQVILIHHFAEWIMPAEVARAAIVITGHTHEPANHVRDGRLYLNPGECCGWVSGRCTAAIFDTAGPLG